MFEKTPKIIDTREKCCHGNRDVTVRLYLEDDVSNFMCGDQSSHVYFHTRSLS